MSIYEPSHREGVAHGGELSPLQRRIMALTDEGRSQREVAVICGLTRDDVKRHVEKIRDWRALNALRRAHDD